MGLAQNVGQVLFALFYVVNKVDGQTLCMNLWRPGCPPNLTSCPLERALSVTLHL